MKSLVVKTTRPTLHRIAAMQKASVRLFHSPMPVTCSVGRYATVVRVKVRGSDGGGVVFTGGRC